MILWGSNGRLLNLGRLDERECSNCGRVQPFQLSLSYKFFYLYWIFRLVTKKQYSLSCVVCEHGWELESGKVESAMGKPPIPFWDKYGLGVFGVLVAGLVYVFASTPVVRDATTGVITEEGEVGIFQIQLGDCFNDELPFAAQPEQVPEIQLAGVEGLPCTDQHDNEIYAVFDLNLSSFPGEEQMSALAQEACLERFEAFVGREYETSVLDVLSIYPTSESFVERDDREVACAVNHIDGRKLIGSMRGSEL